MKCFFLRTHKKSLYNLYFFYFCSTSSFSMASKNHYKDLEYQGTWSHLAFLGCTQRVSPDSSRDLYAFYGEDLRAKESKRYALGSAVSLDGVWVSSYKLAIQGKGWVGKRGGERQEKPWEMVGLDVLTDIVVFRPKSSERLSGFSLGRSGNLGIGQKVYVMSWPFGREPLWGEGILSAKGGVWEDNPIFHIQGSFDPGYLGGALLDDRGRFVGLILETGLTFARAMPVERLRKIVKAIKDEGGVKRAWLGVMVENVLGDQGLLGQGGLLISQIFAQSPSHEGGLKIGDILLKIENQNLRRVQDLRAYLENKNKIGSQILLKFIRNSEIFEKKFILSSRPFLDPEPHRQRDWY